MRKKISSSAAAWIIIAAASLSLNSANSSLHHGDSGFAVVELFTSEGCSSCPAAEETIQRLNAEWGDRVLFLSYHVDYWDHIGWKDPFSDAQFTKRQERYAHELRLSSLYTPQAVVNGRVEMVGSREQQLAAAIGQALSGEAARPISLSVQRIDSLRFRVMGSAPGSKGNLQFALVQKMAVTDVRRGENEGRVLKHLNIVRALHTVSLNGRDQLSTDFSIPAGGKTTDYFVVALLQDRSLQLRGAARADLH